MSGNLPNAVTPRLLDTLRSQPGLPDDVWYTVVATTLCILNRPGEIQAVYRHAVAADRHDAGADVVADYARQLRIARRLREALLKTSAIGGLPKVSKQASQQRVGHSTTPAPSRTFTPFALAAPLPPQLMLASAAGPFNRPLHVLS